MALDDRSGITSVPVASTASRGLVSRIDFLLNRPLFLGLGAVLASLICCGTLAQTTAISEVKPHHEAAAARPLHRPQPESSDEIPLLCLAFLGLAGLALSQTRPSSEPEHREDIFRAGKNVVRGQELPKTPSDPAPRLAPSLSIPRTPEPHHGIMGLEPAR